MDVQMRDVETEADGSSENDSETNVDSGIDKSGGTSAVNVDSDDETDSEDGSDNDDEDEGIDTGDGGSFPHHDGPLLPKIKMKLSSQPPPPPRRVEASSPSKAEGRKDVTTPTTTTSPIRIKLSLKKLPISGNKVIEADAAKNVGSPSTPSKGASAAKTTKGGGKAAPKALSTIPKAATGTASKRRSLLPPKQVRFPPIPSPGLRLLRPPIPMPSSSDDYYTPQQVFAVTMTAAGYTVEARTRRPHRGSSVQRTVDDLFDTNVLLALHPLELVPSALWHHSVVVSSDSDIAEETSEYTTLPQLLIRGLEEPERTPLLEREPQSSAVDESGSRKRPRRPYAPMPFRDMVPVSLTIPYPESYIEKRKDYVAQVMHREACIVQWQAAQDEFELSQDAAADTLMHSGADSDGEGLGTTTAGPSSQNSRSAAFVNPITVPPIPEPPDPPRLEELRSPSSDNVLETEERLIPSVSPFYYLDTDEDASKNHPIYLPKGKEDLVAHLDPNCFHITEGRYFGLRTSRIADPHFVGPSAPGLASTSTTTGGLATATTSTTTSTSGLTGGGMTMILSASFHSAAAVPAAHGKEDTPAAAATKSQTDTEHSETGREPPAAPSASSVDGAAPVDMSPSTAFDPTSGTAFELRKIMEGSDTALMETFQEAIVRAVVYAFRTHQPQSTAFRAPNGKTYPDIGKAFAIYGGVKTCERCKSNKQGVFHCRIRRRHDDPDFDGGVTSTALLRPLLDAPLETLLLKEDS